MEKVCRGGRKNHDNTETEGTNALLFPDVWSVESKPLTRSFHSLKMELKTQAQSYVLLFL